MTPLPWQWKRCKGSASTLHERPFAGPRSVDELIPTSESAVLGSSQSQNLIDLELADELQVHVARRRGGGGAVWLAPGAQLWLEFTIPVSDPLWMRDVGKAFLWLGRLYQEALSAQGVMAQVHEGAVVVTPASRHVCFGGLGPGEVSVGGRKLVGISQRRTRQGARFQSVLYEALEHERLVSLFGMGEGHLSEAMVDLLSRTTTDAQSLGISLHALRDEMRTRLAAGFGN